MSEEFTTGYMSEGEGHDFELGTDERFKKDFERLQAIAHTLKEMGFDVQDRFISLDMLKNPTAIAGFPLVSDGANAIRVSYEKERGLVIWFTNGLEDPDDPRRQEVVKRLQQEGLYN